MERNGAEPDNIINRGANHKDLIVRPITPGEENEWNILMAKHHYLVFHCLSGRRLKYVILLNGQWVDRSQIRTVSEPRVFATIRNLAISLLRLHGFKNIASSLRKMGWNPGLALSLIGV